MTPDYFRSKKGQIDNLENCGSAQHYLLLDDHVTAILATLDELDEQQLVQILTEPKNALTKQYQKLFKLEGVTLEFRDDALRQVALKAMERKAGARGLRSILENALLETMYELPSIEGVKKVIVDGSVITEGARPLYVYEEDNERAAASS